MMKCDSVYFLIVCYSSNISTENHYSSIWNRHIPNDLRSHCNLKEYNDELLDLCINCDTI